MVFNFELPLWTIRPNWAGGILERLEWLTDVLGSSYGVEQRRALRLSPRRTFEMTFNPIDDARSYFDLWLHRMGSQELMVPLFHDKGKLDAAVAEGDTVLYLDTTNREFVVYDMVLILGDDPFTYDKVTIESISPDSLTLEAGTARAWPKGATVYPLRRSRLSQESMLAALTNHVGAVTLQFELNQENDLADEGAWAALYGGHPVLLDAPNRREAIDTTFMRNSLLLDNEHGLRALSDDAGRAFTMQTHKQMIRGRAAHAAFRRFLYRLRGQQGSIWLPTFNRDLKLSRARVAGDMVLDIKKIGYDYTGGAVSGRRHILLPNGAMHEIDGTTGAPSTAEERLTLTTPLVNDIGAGAYGSFMDICRMAGDSVEITHLTDTNGVAECNLGFRSFRDERTTEGALDAPIAPSLKTDGYCGVPADDGCVPNFPAETNDPDDGGGGDPDPDPQPGLFYDYALIEMNVANMPPKQNHRYYGVVVDPVLPEVAAIDVNTSWFPIQGASWSQNPSDGVAPILAFADYSGNLPMTGAGTTAMASLRVDLTSLPTTSPIVIDIYGEMQGWGKEGSNVDQGYNADSLSGSYWVASLTKDFRGFTVATPAAISSAPEKLFSPYHATYGAKLNDAFPETTGMTVDLGPIAGDDREGDKSWSIDFYREGQTAGNNAPYVWRATNDPFNNIYHSHYLAQWENAVGDDPNAWLIYPVSLAWNGTDVSIQEIEYWTDPAGVSNNIVKTKTMNHSNCQGGLVNGNSMSFHNDPNSSRGGLTNGFWQIQYHVPLWHFGPAQNVSFTGKAVKGANPWTVTTPEMRGNNYHYLWGDPANRPALANLGTKPQVLSDEYIPTATAPNLLQWPKIGTVTISRVTGAMTFTPA